MTQTFAGRTIQTEAGPAVFWGSDCVRCGNTTDGSMTCDECGSLAFTVALWEMAGNRQAIERRSEARDVALSEQGRATAVDVDPPDAVASLSEMSPPTQDRASLPIRPLPKSGIAYQHDLNAREPATQHKHFGYQHGHDRGSVFHDHYGVQPTAGAVLPEYEWRGVPEFWWHRHGRLAHPHEAGSVPHTHERMAPD